MKAGREQYKKEKEEGRYGGTKPSNPKVAALMKKMSEDVTDEVLGELKCWKGYRRKPGAVPGTPGSCIKEDDVNESMYGLGRPGGAAAQRDNRYRQTEVRKAEYEKANRHAQKQKNKEASAYAKTMEARDLDDLANELFEDDMKGMSVKSGHKRSVKQGAGLTKKGVEAYRRKNPGSKLQTAVTTPPSKLKPGSKAAGRRKSFCARSRGWTGERGKAARRRWNC